MRASLHRFCARHPVLAFVLLSYLITWSCTGPFVYFWRNVLGREFAPWLLVFLPGVFGPTIAAIVMTRWLEGRAAVRPLLAKYRIWRVSWKWYLFVVVQPLGVVVAALALTAPEAFAAFDPGAGLLPLLILPLLTLPFGPLPEELGWRGYALPKLLRRHHAITASLLIGLMWTFWHLPMFWFPGATFPSVVPLSPWVISIYLLQITAEAIIFTFIYLRTKGSVLIAILFHATFNAAENVVFSYLPTLEAGQEQRLYFTVVALTCVVAVFCMVNMALRQQPALAAPAEI